MVSSYSVIRRRSSTANQDGVLKRSGMVASLWMNTVASLLLQILLVCSTIFSSSVSSLVLLTPPASHYGAYDRSRTELFDFYADFYKAGAVVNERIILIVSKAPRLDIDHGSYEELVRRGVTPQDLITIRLDDIWVRDYFPTQLSNDTVAQFDYAPAYLDGSSVYWIDQSTSDIVGWFGFPGLQDYSNLILDGGGIVFEPTTGYAIVTDRVLRDNPHLAGRTGNGIGPASQCCPADPYGILTGDERGQFTPAELQLGEERLEADLKMNRVVIVPEEPEVPRLGHVDGIANWLAPGVIALSNFSDPEVYATYESRLKESFGIVGGQELVVVPLPYAVVNETDADGFESAEGIYVNFLRTNQAIYMPIFSIPEDEIALKVAQEYGDRQVVPVNASAISIMGGSVRCLSQHLWGANADAILEKIEARENNGNGSTASSSWGLKNNRRWWALVSTILIFATMF